MANKRKTPIMGFSTWNAYRTNIDEDLIKKQAKALIDTGLAEKGYTFVNIDDGYFGGRDENGNLLFHKDRFPNGIKGIADYIHSLGLDAGIYSDAGDNTCAHYYDNEGMDGFNVGLYNHEEEDLRLLLIDNDFDFIKVDWCGGLRLDLDEQEQYTKISNIIRELSKEKGKDIIYNICRWQFPGEWVVDVADSWRVGADIAPEFSSILYQLDSVKPLNIYNGPGYSNDLDMLEVGNGMSPTEDESHFIMWCMLSTPLLIGADITSLDQKTLDLLKNEELIALNQDEASLAAYVIKHIKEGDNLLGEIWLKNLGEKNSREKAIAFLNRSNEPLKIDFNLEEAGLLGNIEKVRDLIKHEDLNPEKEITVNLEPHQTKVFRIRSTESKEVENLDKQYSFTPSPVKLINQDEANEMIAQGALLVDVRTKEEYDSGHLDGAQNIEFQIANNVPYAYPENKDQEIILYCGSGKRAEEVAQILEYHGYNNIHSLGGLNNINL